MGLDPMEKDKLRRRMATRMQSFAEGSKTVVCVSAHYYDDPAFCELSELKQEHELLVVKNRAGKSMRIGLSSLKEMLRYQVVDIADLEKWVEKLKLLKQEANKRREAEMLVREEERKKLEKKVIVRKAKPGVPS